MMDVLSTDKIYILFGWNGEAKSGVSRSHYIALRHGIIISDLAAGVHNTPSKQNCIEATVSNLKKIFYGKPHV